MISDPLPFQLRGAQILDCVRLHKTGFPESVPYHEFYRKFALLADDSDSEDGGRAKQGSGSKRPHPSLSEMRGAVEDLLAELDMDKAAVRMGNTQVGH